MSEHSVIDNEIVSVYALDQQQIDELLTNARECVLNWSTQDGWPVGVVHSFVWRDGRIWITASAHRHRISAIRKRPKVSVVVSNATVPDRAPRPQAVTIKGIAILHEDRETKDWFYPALWGKSLSGKELEDTVKRYDHGLRVIVEIVPEKFITFDGVKRAMGAAGTLPPEQRGPMLESDAVRLQRELERRGLSDARDIVPGATR